MAISKTSRALSLRAMGAEKLLPKGTMKLAEATPGFPKSKKAAQNIGNPPSGSNRKAKKPHQPMAQKKQPQTKKFRPMSGGEPTSK